MTDTEEDEVDRCVICDEHIGDEEYTKTPVVRITETIEVEAGDEVDEAYIRNHDAAKPPVERYSHDECLENIGEMEVVEHD